MTEVSSIMANICNINFWIENDPPPPFGSFPKIHPFWKGNASLSRNNISVLCRPDKRERILKSKAETISLWCLSVIKNSDDTFRCGNLWKFFHPKVDASLVAGSSMSFIFGILWFTGVTFHLGPFPKPSTQKQILRCCKRTQETCLAKRPFGVCFLVWLELSSCHTGKFTRKFVAPEILLMCLQVFRETRSWTADKYAVFAAEGQRLLCVRFHVFL